MTVPLLGPSRCLTSGSTLVSTHTEDAAVLSPFHPRVCSGGISIKVQSGQGFYYFLCAVGTLDKTRLVVLVRKVC